MITAKFLKMELTAKLIVEEDGKPIAEVVSQPVTIYKGQEFNYEKFIDNAEKLTIQTYHNQRPNGNQSIMGEVLPDLPAP